MIYEQVFSHWLRHGRDRCSPSVEPRKRDELVAWMLSGSVPIPATRHLLDKITDREFAEDMRSRLNAMRQQEAA